MKISSNQLQAFYETAKFRSFSKAAQHIGVTQSALSQRISNLEDDLEVAVFVRDPAGPILTPAGEMLLRHCQITDSLEQEVLSQLRSSSEHLSGVVRIAGFSSVLSSVIIPSMAPFLRAHPAISCEFSNHEVIELPTVLKNGEADFVILDFHLKKSGIVEHLLGREEYVVIESVKFDGPENVYLDHGPHDDATEKFFASQPGPMHSFRRSFMGDVHGIVKAVELGLGRAVMSRHILSGNSKVKVRKGYKRYFCDITLNYFEHPYYSRLHQAVAKQLQDTVPGLLEKF